MDSRLDNEKTGENDVAVDPNNASLPACFHNVDCCANFIIGKVVDEKGNAKLFATSMAVVEKKNPSANNFYNRYICKLNAKSHHCLICKKL